MATPINANDVELQLPKSGWPFATKRDLIEMEKRLNKIMSQMDDELATLTTKVTNITTVKDSVLALIKGIPALIQSAVDSALAAGATPDQLKAVTDLGNTIDEDATELTAAVQANVPPAPPASVKR
jgi:hypothetical protein